MVETDYDDYYAKYCESCGTISEITDELKRRLDEPVHRIDILEAIGNITSVGETVAEELHECQRCGGQVVDRYYVYPVSAVEEEQYEPVENKIVGRDPDEDGLITTDIEDGDEYHELRETAGLVVETDE